MKKILPIVVVSIFVLIGLRAVALPNENTTEINTLNTQEWEISVMIKGGLLGYTIAFTGSNPPIPNGTLSVDITTDATFMLLGKELSKDFDLKWNPGDVDDIYMRPVLGFGPATLSIDLTYELTTGELYTASGDGTGFVLLFLVNCDATPINLP